MLRCESRLCRKRSSLRSGTIFNLIKVPIDKFIIVLVGWIQRYPVNTLIKETGLGKNSVSKILEIFRNLLFVWLSEKSEKIGGPGKTVEVDESAFGRRKYNVGRIRKTRWVVGGIDRESKKCFLKIVDKRNCHTLNTVISEFVCPGTTIITDSWKGYGKIKNAGYIHKTVNHSYNFLNPDDITVNTQMIESHWSRIKRDMRRRIGRMAVNKFENYLVEYVWRSLHNSEEELFLDFIQAINYFYPQ